MSKETQSPLCHSPILAFPLPNRPIAADLHDHTARGKKLAEDYPDSAMLSFPAIGSLALQYNVMLGKTGIVLI